MELEDQLRRIQANVDLFIAQCAPASDHDFGLDRASVEWVDGFVERQRARLAPGELGALPSVVGCFLGACLVEATPGRWARDEEQGWGIEFPSGNWAFPISKARKQFEEGPGDSILAFYDMTLALVRDGRL
ncbi:hypothetical protein ACIBG7_26235 [Nonomuraea sp. NPDC050328]|uniref:hypothetical protein n=1 Tax=Nonomuraea sp. NPDC050328 TaxID=3364361 RepID=UPI0037A9868D